MLWKLGTVYFFLAFVTIATQFISTANGSDGKNGNEIGSKRKEIHLFSNLRKIRNFEHKLTTDGDSTNSFFPKTSTDSSQKEVKERFVDSEDLPELSLPIVKHILTGREIERSGVTGRSRRARRNPSDSRSEDGDYCGTGEGGELICIRTIEEKKVS